MKGELLNFDNVKNLKDNSKVWIIWRRQSSDVYLIKKLNYGINFIKYYSPNDWLSFFMTYTALEYSMNNKIAKIYKWVSNEEYIENKLEIVKNSIEISLDTNDKDKFMRLTTEYKKLLKEKEIID